MTLKLIVKKLQLSKNKFITREEIKNYCKEIHIDYYVAIRYLTHNNYLVRILRGIFYIKSIEERKLNKIDINHFLAIKEALKIKGVDNWYFGLETALKLNNLTHEYFTVDYVVSDKIFRAKPISILNHKVKFVKLTHRLTSFGIIRSKIPYSNPEKTILDLIYLGKYNKTELRDIIDNLSKNKLLKYSREYNKRVIEIVKEAI